MITLILQSTYRLLPEVVMAVSGTVTSYNPHKVGLMAFIRGLYMTFPYISSKMKLMTTLVGWFSPRIHLM